MQTERDLQAWLWATPNSNRVSILLDELGLDYRVHGVNIRRGEQKSPEVVSRNPYGKIPIVTWSGEDGDRTLFESGAILLDFARRHDRLLPKSGKALDEAMSWLMVGLTGLGPTMGQAHHWTDLADEQPEVARAHSVGLVRRVFGVMDTRLAQVPYLADAYSIADIAAFPWIARSDWATIDLAEYPNLARWHGDVAARPAVQSGMAKPEGAVLQG
ncbi:glutathione S-transferase family protein [Pseudoruegeria sp. SK021]|uniref:glutathione S-transferase family protein n=1 Tax=Pseudoruegeria sp. SK021 TaxID=1933035 RepID=UPI000A234FC6|nr:glutathione S-transferase family protein [Pseudoruegeria sp. SK021]OSP54896.1 hypothetical protein BV911_10530 [Pseudoruegeria sp. SK021]